MHLQFSLYSHTSGPAPPAATVAQQANGSVPFRAHVQSEKNKKHRQRIIFSPIMNGAQVFVDGLKKLSGQAGQWEKHTRTKRMNNESQLTSRKRTTPPNKTSTKTLHSARFPKHFFPLGTTKFEPEHTRVKQANTAQQTPIAMQTYHNKAPHHTKAQIGTPEQQKKYSCADTTQGITAALPGRRCYHPTVSSTANYYRRRSRSPPLLHTPKAWCRLLSDVFRIRRKKKKRGCGGGAASKRLSSGRRHELPIPVHEHADVTIAVRPETHPIDAAANPDVAPVVLAVASLGGMFAVGVVLFLFLFFVWGIPQVVVGVG